MRALRMAAPFLLLIAVGLLSAGVIRFVERTAAPKLKTPLDEPAPATRTPVDPRQGWQGSHFDSNGEHLGLRETAGVHLEGILPTSFLQTEPRPPEVDEMPRVEHGLEGPGASLLPVIEYPVDMKPVPEPDSALLLAMGLGLLGFCRQSSGD